MSTANIGAELDKSNWVTVSTDSPSDSQAGYPSGALWIETDAYKLYVNCGTASSTTWKYASLS